MVKGLDATRENAFECGEAGCGSQRLLASGTQKPFPWQRGSTNFLAKKVVWCCGG